MKYLDRTFLTGAARSLLAGRQIGTVTDSLKKAGIPTILLKGPALARSVYPDPAIRQSGDIDLLIQPQNIPAAEDVLEKLGYTCPIKGFHISRHEFHHETFTLPANAIPLELHWVLDFTFKVFPEGVLDEAFRRRIAVKSGDLSFETLSHTDHLLYLAFHDVFQHDSVRLDWIVDISRIMAEFTGEEWEELGRLSVEQNVRIPLELLITAATLWTGCGLPAGVRDLSGWPAPGERELQLLPLSKTYHISVLSWMRLSLQARSGIRQKLRFWSRIIVPPVIVMKCECGSASPVDLTAAYVRRWIRILKSF
jgi:hypothetical protein